MIVAKFDVHLHGPVFMRDDLVDCCFHCLFLDPAAFKWARFEEAIQRWQAFAQHRCGNVSAQCGRYRRDRLYASMWVVPHGEYCRLDRIRRCMARRIPSPQACREHTHRGTPHVRLALLVPRVRYKCLSLLVAAPVRFLYQS